MSALTIASVTVPVGPDGHSQAWEDLGTTSRSQAGYMRSAVTATRGRVRVWQITTPPMTIAEADTLETTLDVLGKQEADGYIVDDTPTDVYIRGLSRSYEQDGNLCSFSFEMHEVAQAAAVEEALDFTVGGAPVGATPVGG